MFCSFIDIEFNGTGFTVRAQVASFPATVAFMLAVPGFNVVITPSFTVATFSLSEVHTTFFSTVVSTGS